MLASVRNSSLMEYRDELLENLYRLRCSCEEQLSLARKADRQALAAEVESQLTLIDEMIERSCARKHV
jgi:hypothetical protein